MLGGAVEPVRRFENRVDPGPEPDQQDADGRDEHREPVPTVRIEQDVEVDHEDGNATDVDTHLRRVVDLMPGLGYEVGRRERQIGHEEAHQGLVDAIAHVHPLRVGVSVSGPWSRRTGAFRAARLPELELRPFLPLDATSV